MKTLNKIIILLSILLIGCITTPDYKIPSNVKLKSGGDTTIVVQFTTTEWKEIDFDSSFVVKSISVNYNEPTSRYATQRALMVQFIDNGYSSVLLSDTITEGSYVATQNMFHFLYQTQSMSFLNLNKRCNQLWVFGQPNTGRVFTFTIIGHYSNADDNEVVMVYLDTDNSTDTIEFNSLYKIKSIKAQHYGKSNNSFSILSDNSLINISDNSSVTNIKDYTPDEFVNTLAFTMTTQIPSNNFYLYGPVLFTVVVEK